jgi:Fe2+ transport system protein FeoA
MISAEIDAPVRLTRLAAGSSARLLTADLVDGDRALLSALGLARGCRFRVCRAGDPWIVQVRSTRIGLADAVARRLLVLPEAP